MNIQELEDKHGDIPLEPLELNEFYEVKHTKLSIEFAIEKLYEAVGTRDEDYMHSLAINDTVTSNIELMIQELKQYLNE